MNNTAQYKIQNLLAKPWIKRGLILLVILGIGWFVYSKFFATKASATKYTTAQAARDTLIVSITGSGTVSTANSSNISTQATGVVSQVYVKDGDIVKAGDKIAEIDLDLPGKQTSTAAWSSYQSAKNNLDTAKANLYTTQSDMFTNWKSHYDLATNSTYQNSDGSPKNENRALAEFHISEDNWLASEAKYKTQQNIVAQAQTAANSAWLSYQQSSPIIYAPISGTVSGLSLQVGSVITSSSSSSSSTSTQSSTKIASVKTQAYPTVSVNLTEIDIPKIQIGNKATVTFDALTDKTFTGRVMSIDTTGVVSSGVTTYPATIVLDEMSDSILPNMAATANIITATKDNVLLVPVAAVQKNSDGSTYVRMLKNDKLTQVSVETGLSSSAYTEITSGLKEGDSVVTAISNSSSTRTSSSSSSSPFGGLNGNRGFAGGGGMGR